MPASLTVEKATAIINEASNRGVIDYVMPVSEDERLERAEVLYTNARKAEDKAKGAAKDACKAIIRIAESDHQAAPGDVPAAAGHQAQPESPPGPLGVPDGDSTNGDASSRPGLIPREVYEFVYEERGARKVERLPVPPEIDDQDLPVLPPDLTTLNDRELRQLYSKFNAISQRARWLLSREKGRSATAKRLMEREKRKALRGLEKVDPTTNKPKLNDVLDAEAEDNEEVVSWRDKHEKHEDNVKELRALEESYDSDCERISREWSMRTETFQREGGLSGRGPR